MKNPEDGDLYYVADASTYIGSRIQCYKEGSVVVIIADTYVDMRFVRYRFLTGPCRCHPDAHGFHVDAFFRLFTPLPVSNRTRELLLELL